MQGRQRYTLRYQTTVRREQLKQITVITTASDAAIIQKLAPYGDSHGVGGSRNVGYTHTQKLPSTIIFACPIMDRFILNSN